MGEVDSDVLAFYSLRVEAGDGNGNTATTTGRRLAAPVGVFEWHRRAQAQEQPPSGERLAPCCWPGGTHWPERGLWTGAPTPASTTGRGCEYRTRHPHTSACCSSPNWGLTGSIPPELGGVADVRRIDLDYNTLTGGIPRELGNLPDLELLYMDNNQLSARYLPRWAT